MSTHQSLESSETRHEEMARACICVFCGFSEMDCFTVQIDALAQFFTAPVSQGARQLQNKADHQCKCYTEDE